MSTQDNIPKLEDEIEDNGPSIDDFFRELEEKERDLQITADLSIEIAELDLDGDSPAQAFIEKEVEIERHEQTISKPPPAKAATGRAQPAGAGSALPSGAGQQNLQNEIATLKLKVAELRAERSDMIEKKDRQLKDFENFKYRVDRERRGSFIDQIANLATQMLPVLDNLNRAIDAVPEHAEERDPAFTQFFQGIVLVSQQVNEVFAGMGVEPIRALGDVFDPHMHEAVAVVEDPQKKAGTIVEEMLRGYKIGNKIVRHSMVKVVSAPANSPSASHPAADVTEPETDDSFEEDNSDANSIGDDMIERF